ncbi:Uncharacterised protein [Cronobacter sakazakii]|nr:Uncharacterised protein [Cronobacter sakazakii]
MKLKMTLAALAIGVMSASALAADKLVIAHRGAVATCRSIRCLPKRWPMRRARITLSRIW